MELADQVPAYLRRSLSARHCLSVIVRSLQPCCLAASARTVWLRCLSDILVSDTRRLRVSRETVVYDRLLF